MGSSHVSFVYWWWPAAAKMWSIFVAMQDRCPLWSASCSVLIKTLVSSAIWWFCTQSRCSSSFCKWNLQTSPQTLPLLGLCFWLLSSYQPLSPWRPSYHHTSPHDQWRQVSWCADRQLHWSGGEHGLPCGRLSYFQGRLTGSPLVVQNFAWCYPLIQDKTSAGEIYPTLQWHLDLPALWYPQPSTKLEDERLL